MKKKRIAQSLALDRVLYLLEERSIQKLVEEDQDFAAYIDGLYGKVSTAATQLQRDLPVAA